jgi:hypothetical protein
MQNLIKTDRTIETISYSGFLMVKTIGKQAKKAAMKAKAFVNLLPILSPTKSCHFHHLLKANCPNNSPKYFPTIKAGSSIALCHKKFRKGLPSILVEFITVNLK